MAHNLTFDADNQTSISGCINLARSNAAYSTVPAQQPTVGAHEPAIPAAFTPGKDTRIGTMNATTFSESWKAASHSFRAWPYLRSCTTKDGFSFRSGDTWSEFFPYVIFCRRTSGYFGVSGGEELETVDPLNGIGVLRACNSFESYCRVYDPRPETRQVTSFLLLNPFLPNSVRFNVDQMADLLGQVAGATETRRRR